MNTTKQAVAMESKPYDYIIHVAHGTIYLEVTTAEVVAAGIADQISGESYVSDDGQTAYLEARDAVPYIRARGWNAEFVDGMFVQDWTGVAGKFVADNQPRFNARAK